MKPRFFRSIAAQIALLPAWLIVIFAYLGTIAWTIRISFTSTKVFPTYDFVGWKQYERLFATDRWIISGQNLFIFGACFIIGCLIFGFLLAVFIDQKIRAESVFRTIFLYPYAMSFIVTGLVWQWTLNPTLGVQQTVRNWGWQDFTFDWLVRGDRAIYVIAIAGIWQASGLVMAILLAGLRGVDQELWKAAKVDGIPTWRVYLHIIVPMLSPMFVTATVLLATAVVKVYDLVIALTGGGPGISTEVPAKFVIDYLFNRQNVGLATAASTVMFVTVLVVLAPWLYSQYFRGQRGRGA
ncbi:carbohydrate ABC transporter membrane protein 1, CUT1 family (TC 3.A.1.1.-) [Kaistia soli DSM 19436]|uniref:Carbohydrate ABC transporter membrane protein 1, CUT1 family (TC 3.A.1.1.-) n=1 Tax=Kaistia soli DSM 19436 TaxID=1122133 RepID=A0A1M4V772_9HYPH|nr:sugar ABC transporter permease [Kaistia soli]SHE64815.1 carbohydrate ABC transporter membrane protein 1, CUT1 family (TC 3.A.1.1.-) [Kaistia soli DSM 19436]